MGHPYLRLTVTLAAMLALGPACKPRPAPQTTASTPAPPAAPPLPMVPNKLTVRWAAADSEVPLMKAWASERARVDPYLAADISGGGPEAGIKALAAGNTDLALDTRRLKADEAKLMAERAGGLDPMEFLAGFDAVCLYVHPANPLDTVSLEDVVQIYGEGGRLDRWNAAGLRKIPKLADQKIVRLRMPLASSAAQQVQALLGDKGEKPGALEVADRGTLIALVATTPGAIGYGTCSAATDAKVVKVTARRGAAGVAPTQANVAEGKYPLARPLLVHLAGNAGEPHRRYLDWILSESGQRVVESLGYVRAPAAAPPPPVLR